MANGADSRLVVNIPEQFNRRSYFLDQTSPHSWHLFRALYNGTQSYYTFRRSCELDRRVRRTSSMCTTIEIDNRPVAIVHNLDFHRTGNINVTIVEYPSDPHFNPTIYLMPQINI
jgi:hypothetical protein